jgi:hypothetical protein
MRPQDRAIFKAAAQHLQAWVLLRDTNRHSLQYIGQPGYTPKRIDCKAKTVDFGPLAGLVGDPTKRPNDFKASKLEDARHCWEDFLKHHGALTADSKPYSLVTDRADPKYGAVKDGGKYVHGDYDVYDVVPANMEGKEVVTMHTLHGCTNIYGPLLMELLEYANSCFPVPMVRHGEEVYFKDHSDQSLLVFGPKGEELTLADKQATEQFYLESLNGREPFGSEKSPLEREHAWRGRIRYPEF